MASERLIDLNSGLRGAVTSTPEGNGGQHTDMPLSNREGPASLFTGDSLVYNGVYYGTHLRQMAGASR